MVILILLTQKHWTTLSLGNKVQKLPLQMVSTDSLQNDKYGNLTPAVAEDWSVSQDGLTYTYKIRKGVKWLTSDGEEYAEVTANDFVTGLKHAADNKISRSLPSTKFC